MSNLHLVSRQDDTSDSGREVDRLFSSPGFRQRYERARQSILNPQGDDGGCPSRNGRLVASPTRPEVAR